MCSSAKKIPVKGNQSCLTMEGLSMEKILSVLTEFLEGTRISWSEFTAYLLMLESL